MGEDCQKLSFGLPFRCSRAAIARCKIILASFQGAGDRSCPLLYQTIHFPHQVKIQRAKVTFTHRLGNIKTKAQRSKEFSFHKLFGYLFSNLVANAAIALFSYKPYCKAMLNIFLANFSFSGRSVSTGRWLGWGIGSLGIWLLFTAKLQAATQLPETGLRQDAKLNTSMPNLDNSYSNELQSSSPLLRHQPFLIAAPENFNPSLQLAPPKPPEPPTPPVETDPTTPIVWDSLQIDFRNSLDNIEQHNRFIEPTAQFRLPNGNKITFKTGFNSFEQPGVESITNIPFQVGWEGKIEQVTVRTALGVDLFDRLPTAINLNAKVELPIGVNVTPAGKLRSGLVVSAYLEQAPYKSNARTLDNQITAWRLGPDLYWQIDSNTSLFASYRLGKYNDGNDERQLFSRLERKFGQFSVAANLFNWSYDRNLETTSGYFSPPDFLVYNAELAWEGDVFEFLRCRLSATLGQQRLQGRFDRANDYQARCTAKISPNVEADLGYAFSNVKNNAGADDYNGRTLTSQLRFKF